MKLLLDENLPHALRQHLVGHESFTVSYLGWKGLSNGKLLRKAAEAGFDAMLTCDAGIEFEHNPAELPLSIVILVSSSNTMRDFVKLIPALLTALSTLPPQTLVKVS